MIDKIETYLPYMIMLGGSVKFFWIAFLDEIAIGVYCILKLIDRFKLGGLNSWREFMRVSPISLALSGLLVIASIKGFIIMRSVNSARYLIISFIAVFLINNRILASDNNSVKHWKIAAWMMLSITIALPIMGFICDLPIAWWQESLWVGTSYASIYVLFAGYLIAIRGTLRESYLMMAAVIVAALVNDSRAMQVVTILVLAVVIYRSITFSSNMWKCRKNSAVEPPIKSPIYILYKFFLLISLNIYINYPENYSPTMNPGATLNKISGVLGNADLDVWGNDIDRKNQIDLVLRSLGSQHTDILIGKGILTYQKYYKHTKQETINSRFRPIGFTAFALSYGLTSLVFLLINGYFSANLKNNKDASAYDSPITIMQVGLTIAFIALLFVTDPIDSMLFWLVVSSNTLSLSPHK